MKEMAYNGIGMDALIIQLNSQAQLFANDNRRLLPDHQSRTVRVRARVRRCNRHVFDQLRFKGAYLPLSNSASHIRSSPYPQLHLSLVAS